MAVTSVVPIAVDVAPTTETQLPAASVTQIQVLPAGVLSPTGLGQVLLRPALALLPGETGVSNIKLVSGLDPRHDALNERVANNRALANLPGSVITTARSNPVSMQLLARNGETYDRNPRTEAERFVERMGFRIDATQRQRVVDYIAKRFLQVSDERIDETLNFLRGQLRNDAGNLLGGNAVLERLRKIDPTEANNAQAARNLSGAALSATTQLAADTAVLLGKMLIAPPPEVTLGDPSAMQRYRQQSEALDRFFSRAGDRAAQFVGADPSSALYREGKSAAELALLIGGVLKLAPGAIRLARVGKDVVLIFNDAKALQRAVNNPALQKELAIVISNRDRAAINTLPKELQIRVRKLLKEWPDDPRAANGLRNMPTTPPRTALVNRIAREMDVYKSYYEKSFEYRLTPDHYISGDVFIRNGRHEMTFLFRSNAQLVNKSGGGADMFNAVMQRLKQEGIRVDVIIGRWNNDAAIGDNYKAFVRLRSMGLSPEQAALRTPTGQLAVAHGYKNASLVPSDSGDIVVHFSK